MAKKNHDYKGTGKEVMREKKKLNEKEQVQHKQSYLYCIFMGFCFVFLATD